MAIIKRGKNIIKIVKNNYTIKSMHLSKVSDTIKMESAEESITLTSGKKINVKSNGKG